MRQYKTEKYTREDGKVVITRTCTNPHWDAMPGEFDEIYLYDPVKAEQAKDWADVYTFKTRNGRRTWMYTFIGVGIMIGGGIGEHLTMKSLTPYSPPGPAWSYIPVLIIISGLITIVARLVYVGNKLNPYKGIKCNFPEDPGAF